jgi:DNA-binding FadR family transcriptional regulator
MSQATAEDLERVEEAVAALEKKVQERGPDIPAEARDELNFHRGVLYCTHNPYVIKIGEMSLELFFQVVQNRMSPLPLGDAARDHRSIYESLKNKDPDRLRQVLQRIFPLWYERFEHKDGGFSAGC